MAGPGDLDGYDEKDVLKDESDQIQKSALFQHLTRQLSFHPSDAERACKAVENWNAVSNPMGTQDKALPTKPEANEDESLLNKDRLALAMDWLCLHLSDDQLKLGFQPNPAAMDNNSKDAPQRTSSNGALLVGMGLTKAIPHASISVAKPLNRAEMQAMFLQSSQTLAWVRLGFRPNEAEHVFQATNALPLSDKERENTAIRMLLSNLEHETLVSKDGESAVKFDDVESTPADLDYALVEREQEVQALEAIYADGFQILHAESTSEHDLKGEAQYQLALDPISLSRKPHNLENCALQIFTRKTYPIQAPPLFLFKHSTVPPTLLRKINATIVERAVDLIGEPMVFTIMEQLPDLVSMLHEEFVMEQQSREYEAQQQQQEKEKDDGDDEYENTNTEVGRRQRARLKAAEKAYNRDGILEQERQERKQKNVERLRRIHDEEKVLRLTLAERAIQQREKERIEEEAVRAERMAMSKALNAGKDIGEARDAAKMARIQSLRVNGVELSENEQQKEGNTLHDPEPNIVQKNGDNEGLYEDDESGSDDDYVDSDEELQADDCNESKNNKKSGATPKTIAFTQRLKEYYKAAAEKKARGEGGIADSNFSVARLTSPATHRASNEDDKNDDDIDDDDFITRSHVPTPVFTPSRALSDVMNDVVASQKEQPWLVSAEARAPTLEENPNSVIQVNLTAEELRNRDEISGFLRKDLERKYKQAEDWGKKNGDAGAFRSSKNKRLPPFAERFHNMISQRSRLPAYQMKDDIVSTIEANQITVISGDTGCGKTTQVPQLVLDDLIWKGRGSDANIIVTQPRRISAVGVSERIASERCERIGETAGYSIRLENKRSSKTRLLLCTTGILLRRLQVDPDLASVSHVFVDEVHERDLNTDFLLIILKDLLARRASLKLILMSATLNAETFSKYFNGCPTVSIPGRAHPVKEYRLEDVLEVTGYEVSEDSDCAKKKTKDDDKSNNALSKSALRRMYPKFKSSVIHSLATVDESIINYELIAKLLEHITLNHEDGAILVFLPGMQEITKLIEELYKNEFFTNSSRVIIYPLHSSLSTAEQTSVFNVPPEGVRKIVVSTNIAETSITIEDVVFVVDSGRVKENRQDEVNQMPTLVECWVSRASAKQRRGRAGRVRPGIAFHMYSSHNNELEEYQLPEMLRVGLEDLVLQILLLDLGEPSLFLIKAVNPPSALAIRNSLKLLEGLGAVECDWDDKGIVKPTTITTTSEGSCEMLMVSSGLTALGFHLATLPVDPRVGKIMIYGALFGCIDPALTIAASMSARSPFLSPFDNRDAADEARKEFTTGGSDHLTTLTAFNQWKKLRRTHGDRAVQSFLRESFLSRLTLFQMDDLRKQFADLLIDIGFLQQGYRLNRGERRQNHKQRAGSSDNETPTSDPTGANDNTENLQLIKAILCAGLYPNIIVAPRSLVSGSESEKAVGELPFASPKGEVFLHPSTISFAEHRLDSRYCCYHEIVKTSKIYVRDCTTVSEFALLLFGGRLQVYHTYGVITVDDWLRFRIEAKPATLVKHLRAQMEGMLLRKIVSPEENVAGSLEGKAVIQAVSTLVEKEVMNSVAGVVPKQPDRSGADIVRPWIDNRQDHNRGGSGRGRGDGGGRSNSRGRRGGGQRQRGGRGRGRRYDR